MPLTKLDTITALVVIDLQKVMLGLPTVHPVFGFNVTLAVDAMTDRNADAHTNSITRIFPRLGETGTAQQIIDLLDDTAAKANDRR
jgi:hypothetical protein